MLFQLYGTRAVSLDILGVYVITRSRLRKYQFLLINSSYLCCQCSVACFNLDKIQEVSPIGVGGFTIRLYTRNYIVDWNDRLFHIPLNESLTDIFL